MKRAAVGNASTMEHTQVYAPPATSRIKGLSEGCCSAGMKNSLMSCFSGSSSHCCGVYTSYITRRTAATSHRRCIPRTMLSTSQVGCSACISAKLISTAGLSTGTHLYIRYGANGFKISTSAGRVSAVNFIIQLPFL